MVKIAKFSDCKAMAFSWAVTSAGPVVFLVFVCVVYDGIWVLQFNDCIYDNFSFLQDGHYEVFNYAVHF